MESLVPFLSLIVTFNFITNMIKTWDPILPITVTFNYLIESSITIKTRDPPGDRERFCQWWLHLINSLRVVLWIKTWDPRRGRATKDNSSSRGRGRGDSSAGNGLIDREKLHTD